MLRYIQGDILDIEEGIICHQVNCQSAMGSGVAGQIRAKWPQVYEDYIKDCESYGIKQVDRYIKLGEVVYSHVEPELFVASIYGQYTCGGEDFKYTNYAALFKGLEEVVRYACAENKKVYVPKRIGCGLAHGNWDIVETYLEDLSDMYNENIYVVEKSI